jgi:hypothetical protein
MGAQTFFLIWAERTSVSADPASAERLQSGVFSGSSERKVERVSELRSRRVSQPSALTSEIRRATNTDEICHFTTLLNASGDETLLAGTRLATV